MDQTRFLRFICTFLSLLCVFAVVTAFKTLSSVFMPLIVAILLALVFYPLCKKLNKLKIPWILCVLIIIITAYILLYIVGQILVSSLTTVINSYPKYESRFTSIYQTICDTFSIDYDEETSLLSNMWNSLNIRQVIQKGMLSFSSVLMSFGKQLMLISLFIAFLLIEIPTLGKKTDLIFEEQDKRGKVRDMARKTVSEVTHYISIKFLISLITGILVGFSTFIIKMDFPVIWGFMAFILNFIPSFGSIISWGLTTLFALLQFYPNWGYIIYVAIMVLSINMILGNVVEPRWEGSDLGISPFMILVSLSFFGWLWGFVGMIMAVPCMVIIKIICENTNELKAIAILMGNGTPSKKMKNIKKNKEEQ